MTGFDAWRISSTIKMHFESERYDAFRFCFKAKNISPRVFEQRNDRYFFDKLVKRYHKEDEIRRYAFANIFFGNNTWIGGMEDHHYVDYCKRLQTFSYRLKGNLKNLPQVPLDDLLVPTNGKLPIIIQRALEGDLMMEIPLVLNGLTGFIAKIKGKVNDALLWPELSMKLIKATPFISIDIDLNKSKKIILDHFNDVQSS
jgi:hypothetical protein